MSSQRETINRYTVAFQLKEALAAIHLTLGETERNEDADPALWVFFGDILDHLCLAWHERKMGPDQVTEQSQDEYELKAVSVPNWGERFRLVELVASHPGFNPQLSRRDINRDTVRTYIREAEAALRNAVVAVESRQFDSADTSSFANQFVPILRNLCLAWHLRYLTGEEISSIEPGATREVGYWLPRWQWNLRLTPLGEEPKEVEGSR